MLYKYPQAEFPYARLVDENRRRGADLPEFELLDTGVFDNDRYFDVFVEYAKAAPDDILMLVTVHNRGPEPAKLFLLPQFCFRNIWSWKLNPIKPKLAADSGGINVEHRLLGRFRLDCGGNPALLFCENETNSRRLYGRQIQGYFKDAFHDYVVNGNRAAVNPNNTGTKAAALYALNVQPGTPVSVRVRLVKLDGPPAAGPKRMNSTPPCSATSRRPTPGWSNARHLPA